MLTNFINKKTGPVVYQQSDYKDIGSDADDQVKKNPTTIASSSKQMSLSSLQSATSSP
jgi:hypothetical protein